MREPFYYKIANFGSGVGGMGGEGFNINLGGSAAKKLYETPLPGDEFLRKFAYDILGGCFKGRSMYGAEPIVFAKMPDGRNSCLLKACEVPGVNGCCIYAESSSISSLSRENPHDLNYVSHNIDDKLQAYALLSIWLCWANVVESVACPRE
jgi:hypothetical protein